MEMTVGTVSVNTAPAQQNSSASQDTGFSQVLSGVRPAQNRQPSAEDQTASEFSGSQDGELQLSEQAGEIAADAYSADAEIAAGQEITVTADETAVRFEAVSIKLEKTIARLVRMFVKDDEANEDEILKKLLEILKKISQKEEDDPAANLVMQILVSMLNGRESGGENLYYTAQTIASASIMEITAVKAEFFEIASSFSGKDMPETVEQLEALLKSVSGKSAEEAQSAEAMILPEGKENLDAQTLTEPTDEVLNTAQVLQTPQETEKTAMQTEQTDVREIPETAQSETKPEASENREMSETAQNVAANGEVTEARTFAEPAKQTETAAGAVREAVPASMESMLNDILAKAREELGLVKAEFKQTVQPEQKLQSPQEAEIPQKAEELPKAAETAESAQTAAKQTVLEIRPNHRDVRSELNSILGESTEKNAEEPKKIQIFERGAAEAGLQQGRLGRETAPVNEEIPQTRVAPPERQLADELLLRSRTMKDGDTEFTMELNPETLGKITVKMVSVGGKIAVSVTAENEMTRQLLQARTDQVGTALRENGVELERYQVVSEREEAQLMQDSYDGSSRNPYGRQDNDGSSNDEDGDDFLEILQQL